MAVINTGLLTKGLKSEFFNRFEGTKKHFQDLATRIPSTSDSETYRWLGTVPQIREWGADSRQPSASVDRDEIADDQTGQIRLRVGELAERAATHKDFLTGQLLINGATGPSAISAAPVDLAESGFDRATLG